MPNEFIKIMFFCQELCYSTQLASFGVFNKNIKGSNPPSPNWII